MALYRTGAAGVLAAPPRIGADEAAARAPDSARLPCGAHLALASTRAELEALKDQWLALEAEAGSSHGVFQSYEWVSAWARVYADARTELCVVSGHRDGRLVFLLPLMKTCDGVACILRWITEPFGQYGDIVLAQDEDAGRWMGSALAFLKKLKGVDSIRLRHVRDDAAARPFLESAFRSAKSKDGAPCLDLAQYPDEAAYDARYSKEQRRRRKRIRKELEEKGPVEFRLLDGLCADKGLRDALAEKQKWIGERGLWSRALSCPKLLEFLQELRRGGGRNMRLVTSHLSAGGQPISWEIGLRFKDRHCGFITAHSVALTDASPARLHMDLSQRRAIADGMKVFDLMIPMDAHKDSWSNRVVPVQDYYAALSFKGWLHGVVYFEGIRPVLRHLYYNAPEPVRHFLTGLAKLRRSIFK
jgi:CelD/BcsL family acetyltransferase involved in cellulose biosynthesis